MRRSIVVAAAAAVVLVALTSPVRAQRGGDIETRLKAYLRKFPTADANKDGVLTFEEARKHLEAQRGRNKDDGPGQDDAVSALTAEQLEKIIADGRKAAGKNGPLSFPKGNGLRVVMTGHSWVRPGANTLPAMAKAGGFDGHQQRAHLSGGGTGSANSIWLKEVGRYRGTNAPVSVLLPAIATGQWDVMTWGGYYNDKPVHFTQWMDVCLKYNPQMVFYLQDGWPRQIPTLDKAPADEAVAAYQRKYGEIEAVFRTMLGELKGQYAGKVRVIPAGRAVTTLLRLHYEKKLPGVDCVSEHLGGKAGVYRDGGHLSRQTEPIVGYLYYAMLYRRSPVGIEGYRPPGVSKALDAILRRTAWEAVTTSSLSGIKDEDGNGVADGEKTGDSKSKTSLRS